MAPGAPPGLGCLRWGKHPCGPFSPQPHRPLQTPARSPGGRASPHPGYQRPHFPQGWLSVTGPLASGHRFWYGAGWPGEDRRVADGVLSRGPPSLSPALPRGGVPWPLQAAAEGPEQGPLCSLGHLLAACLRSSSQVTRFCPSPHCQRLSPQLPPMWAPGARAWGLLSAGISGLNPC